MDIQVESRGDVKIVHIKGKVTFEYCPALQSRLDSILDKGIRRIVIDFKEVPFIDRIPNRTRLTPQRHPAVAVW